MSIQKRPQDQPGNPDTVNPATDAAAARPTWSAARPSEARSTVSTFFFFAAMMPLNEG